ncbi:MAG: hypothetical protein LPH21_06315 [Shewanella sp.]|nr:hypothetical protein [Shewanella sp.]
MRVFNHVSRFITLPRVKRRIFATARLNEQDGDLFGIAIAYIVPAIPPAVFLPAPIIFGKPGKISGTAIHDLTLMIAREAALQERRGNVAAEGQVIRTFVQGDGELNGIRAELEAIAVAYESQIVRFNLGVNFTGGGDSGTTLLELRINNPLESLQLNANSIIAYESWFPLLIFRISDTHNSQIAHDNSGVPFPIPLMAGSSLILPDFAEDPINLPVSYDFEGSNTRVWDGEYKTRLDFSSTILSNLWTTVAPTVAVDPCWYVPQGMPKIYYEGLPDLFFGPCSSLARGLLSYLYPSSPNTTLSTGFWSNMPPTLRTRNGCVYNFDGSHYIINFWYPPISEEWSVFIRFKPMNPPGTVGKRTLWKKIDDDEIDKVEIFYNFLGYGLAIRRGDSLVKHIRFSLTNDEWHTLGVSFQCPKEDTEYKDGPLIVYVDGEKLTVSQTNLDCPVIDPAGEISMSVLETGQNFIGYISTVCYWQRALSIRELRVLAYDLFPANKRLLRQILE